MNYRLSFILIIIAMVLGINSAAYSVPLSCGADGCLSIRIDYNIFFDQPPEPDLNLSTLTGGIVTVYQDIRTGSSPSLSIIDIQELPSLAGGSRFVRSVNAILSQPPDPDSLLFSFSGLTGGYITQAWRNNEDVPPEPDFSSHLINLGTVMSGESQLAASGPIYVFDDPILMGTWSVQITPTPPSAVPEPSTLLLLGVGLAGVVAYRKK